VRSGGLIACTTARRRFTTTSPLTSVGAQQGTTEYQAWVLTSCAQVSNVPGTKLSGSEFLRFWVSYSAGSISVGTGAPGAQPPCYTWRDPTPEASIQHVGLSSWDHHVAYRNIQISEPLEVPAPAAASPDACPASAVGSLQDQCMAMLQRSLSVACVCTVLSMADVMRPAADVLRDAAIAFLAEHLPEVLAADAPGLQALSFDCMLDVLSNSALVRTLQHMGLRKLLPDDFLIMEGATAQRLAVDTLISGLTHAGLRGVSGVCRCCRLGALSCKAHQAG
jgi:Farnesoic acid 0-methyl transferase